MVKQFQLCSLTAPCWLGRLLLIGVIALSGCWSQPSDQIVISGEATYDGKPIPVGELIFTPDTKKGNKGPQGRAKIQQGKFTTAGSGRDIVGGPYQVELKAFDGVAFEGRELVVEEGKPLFGSVRSPIDLPLKTATLHVEVTTHQDNPRMTLSVAP
ncbi:hypothetical protein DSM3645_18321 [Blastopirellula marina DSM 3645]|uniref:Carboxypeptidase regulatory-like domain-containing protein n=2 Tax=Blastopirellula marina TaxID=124 RepID=A3ZYV8_9BACT|nr:hypothetical protein DSM3645_18321 [Blastopirellula marina DSM 3645]